MNRDDEPPVTLAEFQAWVEERYRRVRDWRETPPDETLFEDAAEQADECVAHATFFGYPEAISIPYQMAPLSAMRIMGQLLAWIRDEKHRESPFLSVDEAAVYLQATPDAIYRAVESRKLNCGRVGKELRFTHGQLNQYASEQPVRKKASTQQRKRSR